MKILDSTFAQATLLSLILSVPILFANGIPGSESHSFNFEPNSFKQNSTVPESTPPVNADNILVDESEEQQIQLLKNSSAPTRLSQLTDDNSPPKRVR